MGRPKIVEVDYYEFSSRLRKAIDNGRRLEKTDQPAWDEYDAIINNNSSI